MDVNLIVVILTSFVLVFMLISFLFSVDNHSKKSIKFFKNEKYHKYIFFVTLGIVLFLIQIMILTSRQEEYVRHVIMIAILLILFRRGVVEK